MLLVITKIGNRSTRRPLYLDNYAGVDLHSAIVVNQNKCCCPQNHVNVKQIFHEL